MEGPSKAALKHEAESGPLRQLTGRTRTDHIVVFEGNARLIGQTVAVAVNEATAFTLFGTVVTGEQIGVDEAVGFPPSPESIPPQMRDKRMELPVIG